jgi:hypothetical protein
LCHPRRNVSANHHHIHHIPFFFILFPINGQPSDKTSLTNNLTKQAQHTRHKYLLTLQLIKMKLSVLSIAALLLTESAMAFVPCHPAPTRGVAVSAVELKPEPEGGEEMTAIKTMVGSRMKNMGEAVGIKSDQGTVYRFWMEATANGALIKELNNQVLKDAKKKANFPGFRKGQVPPFAMRKYP